MGDFLAYCNYIHIFVEENHWGRSCNMARAIRETPVLYGKDAERFEKEIRETQPLSEERKSEMREQYKSFMRKVNIKVEKKRWI